MQCIAFAEGLRQGSEEMGEIVVGIDIGRVLLYGVLHLQDCRELTGLGIEHTDAIHFFDGEVDVLKHLLALAAGAERLDGDGHAHADG